MPRWSRTLLVTVIVALATIGTVAGGTLGAPTSPGTSADSTAIERDALALQADTLDADLESGESFWQGWELGVDASGVVDGDDRDLEVWLVTEDGELSQRVATVTADEDGQAVVGTNRLNGRYVLRYNDDPVYVQQGQAYLESPPDGSAVTVETSTFSVVPQELDFEWSDPEVYPGQDTALTASTNRDRSVVAVSADGLTYTDLTMLVPNSMYAPQHDARAANDQLLIEITPNSRFRLNTTVLSPGTQPLTFRVVDTTARARSSLTVKSPASNRGFRSVEGPENVGDVLEVELACNHCYLVVGNPGDGILDIVELRDSNGDDQVTVLINTRYAGLYPGAAGTPNEVRPYTSPSDSVRRYSAGTKLEQVDEELSYSVDTLGALRDRLGLDKSGREQPLGPGRFQLTVASTDFLIDRSDYGSGPPYGSPLVIRDETDARTVELTPRSLGGVQSMAAPGGVGFEPTREALRSGAGPRDRVALGDRLVFRVHVTGVWGYLASHGASIETLGGNQEEGIDLSFKRLSGDQSERVRLGRVDVRVVPDPSMKEFYLVFRTGDAHSRLIEPGRYELTFSLAGVSGENPGYSTRSAYNGYPYLPPGARESRSATVTVEPPAATIVTPPTGDSPRLTGDGTLEVRGTTSVAAGTFLDVHASSTEFAWETSARVTANQTGHWRVKLDFGNAPGSEFTVTISRDDRVLDNRTFTLQTSNGSDGEGEGDNGADGGGGDAGDGGDGGDESVAEEGGGSLLPGGSLLVLGLGFLGVMLVLVVWRLR